VSGATFRTLLPHLSDQLTCHVIDLPGAGSSRFTTDTPMTVEQHIQTVRRVVDVLGLDDIAVVGHDSGGLIARYALAGDARVRVMGLIDTEQSGKLTWRFRSFFVARHAPGFGAAFGWAVGHPRIRRNPLVLGGAFVDSSLLDGEFDEFFLEPLRRDPARRDAAVRLLCGFDMGLLRGLTELHRRIDVPVHLVWGDQDPFLPVAWAREMAGTFPDAQLSTIEGAGLFSHEERPAEVADALLPTLSTATGQERPGGTTPR
jgi:pimeloyl-ACP methyl ester carboxylesterase